MADVSAHYAQGNLIEAIRSGLIPLGKSTDPPTIDDLAPVDEFHIGGRKASEDFFDLFGFQQSGQGSGCRMRIGWTGPFRCKSLWLPSNWDLTPKYVETGNILCEWVDLRLCEWPRVI